MRAIAALVILLTACAAPGDEPISDEPAASAESQCERLVRRAAEVDVMQDTVTDLDDAILLCDSLADLEAASAKHPDAFDGTPVRDFLANRCRDEILALAPACRDLDG